MAQDVWMEEDPAAEEVQVTVSPTGKCAVGLGEDGVTPTEELVERKRDVVPLSGDTFDDR